MFSKLILFAAAVCPLFAADTVVGGPMTVNVGPRTATIVWIVQDGQVSLKGGGEQRTAPALHVEKTTFTGLKSGASYEYTIPGHEDLKGSFKTAPPAGEPFEFDVYGDTRTRHDVHRKVVAAMLANSKPDFLLQTGDLVADGSDPALWPIFFDIEGTLLRQTAFYPMLGNHERNSSNYYEYMQGAAFYSFNWGNAHVSILDSDMANFANTEAGRQAFWKQETEWLEADLAKSQKSEFRFVAAHHPPITAVSERQGDNPHMTSLMPMLEKYHVTAAFFGHDHTYQHYLKNGVHYIITGGGGAPLYDVDKPPQDITIKVASIENFVRVRVNGKLANVDAILLDGSKLDTMQLEGAAR
ncbi:MAG TPA: metallophosphoesterase [Bryobacteraceae bacterium]|nr:metallophosphoesterase [Bryobacteraceae bacterium]